jgi:hypothetical protein
MPSSCANCELLEPDRWIAASDLADYFIRDTHAMRAICRLLADSGPAAILRSAVAPALIWTIVINAVKTPARRARPHVLVEGREGIDPMGTYGDAATAVSVVTPFPWIAAPIFHAAPRPVFAGTSSSVAMFGYTLTPKATTTHHAKTIARPSQRYSLDQHSVPTVALADPTCRCTAIWSSMKHKESPMSLPRLINKPSHAIQCICRDGKIVSEPPT